MVVTKTTTVPQKMCGTTQEQSRLSYRALMAQQSDVVDVVDVEAVAKERGLGGVHQQMVQPRLMVGGRNSSVAREQREKTEGV